MIPSLSQDQQATSDDPLAFPQSSSSQEKQPNEETAKEERDIVARCSELAQVDLTADTMDPIEWTVRKVIPIPAEYYWNLETDPAEQRKLPVRLKLWHKSIAAAERVGVTMDRWFGQPMAGALGLTANRFEDVTIYMTEEEWRQSERTVAERIAKRKEQEASKISSSQALKLDEETGA